MSLELEFLVKDKATIKINELHKKLKELDAPIQQTNKSFTDTNAGLISMAKNIVGVTIAYQAMNKIVSDGFAFNKAIEEAKNGLASLSVATQSKAIPVMERYAIANKEATKTLEELQKINVQTPHTLDQTNKIYKAMYVSMKNAGATTSDMIELTRSLSIASGAAGIEFNSLLAGVDGLASGTVLANSDLGRFLSSLGLTNEALKDSDNVVKLVTERLKDFKAADTMSVAVSNLENSWNSLTGELTKTSFESAKKDINAIAGLLEKATHWAHEWNIQQASMMDVKYNSGIDDTKLKLKQLEEQLRDLNRGDWIGSNAFKSAQGIAAERIKLEHEINSLKKSLQKKIQESEKSGVVEVSDFRKQKTKEELEELGKIRKAKEEATLNKKIGYASGANQDAASESYYKMLEDREKLEADFAEMMGDSYSDLLEMQIELAESSMAWSEGLNGVAGAVANVAKATQKINVSNLKFEKSDLKLQKEYAKNYLAVGNDIGKQKELEKKFDTDKAKLKEAQNNAELAGYANLAGAMSSAYETGSKEATAFAAIQSALGIASSWTAIAQAWALPFPANLGAVAMVASAVMPIIQQLGGSGGGGGSLSIEQIKQNTADSNIQNIEYTYRPITDRLDAQIDLLESIDQQGTAGVVGLEKALVEYNKASAIAYENAMAMFGYTYSAYNVPGIGTSVGPTDGVIAQALKDAGFITYDFLTSTGSAQSWLQNSQISDFNKLLEYISIDTKYLGGGIISGFDSGTQTGEVDKLLSSLSVVMSEFATSLGGIIDEMTDAADSFRDIYDSITNTNKYADIELAKATDDIDKLRGTSSFADYLEEQIANISAIEDVYGRTVKDLLLSTDINDIKAQSEALIVLSEATNQAFLGGAEDALNYLDSIELVGNAMATSTNNIKSWVDSFKTQEELAADMMSAFSYKKLIWSPYDDDGVELYTSFLQTTTETLATSMEELNAIYERMANDVDGLTDAELEALNANKALIEAQTSLIDNAVASFTSNMQSMADSIDNTINSLQGYTMTSDEFTDDQIKRINETQRAFESSLASGDSEKAKELLNEITSLSSSIASGTFGDSSLITGNLITQLEANRALVDFEDTVLQVRIVADDTIQTSTTTTTPSVYVTNSTDSTDTNYVITALLEQLLITNKNVLDTLEELNNKVV